MSPNVTQEEKRRTHEHILETAEALFLRKGISETSMNDIVAESGLSKGAIYNHFENKEALLLAIHLRQVEAGLESIRGSFPVGVTPVEKLRIVGDNIFASAARFPRKFQAMNIEFSIIASQRESLAPGIERRYTEIHSFIEGIVAEGIESGDFMSEVSPRDVATLLFATADGLTLHYATTGVDLEWQLIGKAFLDLTLNGLIRR